MEYHTGLALSIRQPYLTQILAGTKRFEYRNRPYNVKGRVWLYAPKRVDEGGEDMPVGLILGSVCLVGCYSHGDRFKIALSYPETLLMPMEAQGTPQPGLWRPKALIPRTGLRGLW